MCHLNDALACPSACFAKQKSFAAAFKNCQLGKGFASFPHRADATPHTWINHPDHGELA